MANVEKAGRLSLRSYVASSTPTPPAGGRGTTRQRRAPRPRRAPGQDILREARGEPTWVGLRSLVFGRYRRRVGVALWTRAIESGGIGLTERRVRLEAGNQIKIRDIE